MSLSYSHGRELVEQTRPFLEADDAEGFVRFLGQYWPADRLVELLTCGHEDGIKIALVSLSLIGDMPDCPAIAPLLHDDDGHTASLAEHALWAIWFRAGGSDAGDRLAAAVQLIDDNNLGGALEGIAAALERKPEFAEAYHQLAMIEFLRGDYVHAVTHCRAALILNPWHFGAMAGLGHCHAAVGEYEKAHAAYQRALQLNPRLEGVRQAIRYLREAVLRKEAADSVNTFTNL